MTTSVLGTFSAYFVFLVVRSVAPLNDAVSDKRRLMSPLGAVLRERRETGGPSGVRERSRRSQCVASIYRESDAMLSPHTRTATKLVDSHCHQIMYIGAGGVPKTQNGLVTS